MATRGPNSLSAMTTGLSLSHYGQKKRRGGAINIQEGKEEILNRRIGQNELSTIQVCLAYVDAQREYALQDQDHDGVLEYAQKFFSEQGKRDGLEYWETGLGKRPALSVRTPPRPMRKATCSRRQRQSRCPTTATTTTS